MSSMGVLDRFLNTMRLTDEDYEDDYDDDEEMDVAPRRRSLRAAEDDEEESRPVRSKVTPMPRTKRTALKNDGMQVCVIKPVSVEDSKAIVDTLLDNRTVVINLEGIDWNDAQRVMDYTSGASMALDGHLQKISKSIYIVTPRTVDISGDFQDLLGSVDVYDARK